MEVGLPSEVSSLNSIDPIKMVSSWLIYFSIPAGVIALAMLGVAMPAGFPYQMINSDNILKKFNLDAVRKLDFLGASLLLAASVLLITALEEGGTDYSWTSAAVSTLLCLSVVLWIIFFSWEKYASDRQGPQEPVLPWRLLQDRFTTGFFLSVAPSYLKSIHYRLPCMRATLDS